MKMCDESGTFSCSPYDDSDCNKGENGTKHSINPYANKKQRFLFHKWTLDHRYVVHFENFVPISITYLFTLLYYSCRIEKQTDKPESLYNSLLLSMEKIVGKNCSINTKYIYELLCTKRNLNLVHTDCHPKKHNEVIYIVNEKEMTLPPDQISLNLESRNGRRGRGRRRLIRLP